MSVVAVRVEKGKVVFAADSIRVYGHTQEKDKGAKLFRHDDLVVGHAGLAAIGAMLYLYAESHKPRDSTEYAITEYMAEFASWARGKGNNGLDMTESCFLIGYKGAVWQVYNFFVKEVTDYNAIGAGADFALAVLWTGGSPKKAVAAACELSIYCEKPINVIEMKRG